MVNWRMDVLETSQVVLYATSFWLTVKIHLIFTENCLASEKFPEYVSQVETTCLSNPELVANFLFFSEILKIYNYELFSTFAYKILYIWEGSCWLVSANKLPEVLHVSISKSN